MATDDRIKPVNDESGCLVANAARRRSFLKKQKSVSFGMVRIHKITQGVDPPSSSQAPSEFSDSDLIERGLFSLETYEHCHRSPIKKPIRTRRLTNKQTAMKSTSLCIDMSGDQDVQMSLSTKLAAVCKNKANYRVIKTVGDEYPGNVLMAHEVSPRRGCRTVARSW